MQVPWHRDWAQRLAQKAACIVPILNDGVSRVHGHLTKTNRQASPKQLAAGAGESIAAHEPLTRLHRLGLIFGGGVPHQAGVEGLGEHRTGKRILARSDHLFDNRRGLCESTCRRPMFGTREFLVVFAVLCSK